MQIRKPSPSVTIKDIASDLGMVHSTVSRALNNRSHISEATKARVREAAERLGYVPNLSARMIRGDAGLLVGLIVPDIQNDFYSSISKELADRCRKAGLRLLLAITDDDPETENNEIRALLEARVSGVIATLTSNVLPASLAMLSDIPCVQLVRRVPALKSSVVCMQDELACGAATEHLIALGHRRIGYVGTTRKVSTGRDRVKGFLLAHEKRGIEPLVSGVELVPPRQEFGYDAVAKILARDPGPTAILIGSSELTIGGMRAIRDAGLDVPRDISVIGYGDPVWFDLLSPPLTAVGLPVSELADAAANQIFAQLDESRQSGLERPSVNRVAPRLVERKSTTSPR